MERPIPMPFIAVRYPERPVPGMKNWELRCSAQAPVREVCRNQRKVICITVSCGRRKKGRRCYSDCWGPAFRGIMEPSASFSAWICIGEGKDAAKKMLHTAWKQGVCSEKSLCGKQRRSGSSVRIMLVYYIRKRRTGFRAFSIGFTWNGKEWVKRPDFKYEIGWCGQNASLALSLLYDYQMNGREESLRYGTAVLDSWVEKARSKERAAPYAV